MFKLERDRAKYVQLEMNGDILNISVGGVKQFRDFLNAQERLVEVQRKVENLENSNETVQTELLELLGDTIIYVFEVALGKANTKKICEFFEDNYDEMLLQIMPFLRNEYIPKLRESAREESRRHARALADVPANP